MEMDWKDLLIDLYMRRAEKNVLEVGTGFGANLSLLLEVFPDSTIVTVDPELSASNRVPQGVHFVQSSAESLPFRDESFDLLSTVATIHHLTDVQAALGEFRRVLRCTGRLVIMDWTPDSRYNPHGRERVARSMEEVMSSVDHYVQVIHMEEEEDYYVICGAKLC